LYNVLSCLWFPKAGYFGLFSDNRPYLAKPYFDNVDMYLDLGYWRANFSTWGTGRSTRGAG
jgi:hypothetical protein